MVKFTRDFIMSEGLCKFSDENNPDEMISKADELMYENKKNKNIL